MDVLGQKDFDTSIRVRNMLLIVAILLSVAAIVIAVILALMLIRAIVPPIREIQKGMEEIEAGNLNFSIRPVNLADCCRNSIDTIRHRVVEGVSLTFTPDDPSLLLNTDPLRLQQLLVNLLINAAKFTEKGEINLSFHSDQGQMPSTDRYRYRLRNTCR